MIAGIFAFMPIEEATTVHTTIQGTEFNQFKNVFVGDTEVGNATAGCGTGNAGLAYWTVFNDTLANANAKLVPSTTFVLTTDGVADGANEIDIILAANLTTASGVVSFVGTTAKDIIIGGASGENVGDILLSVQCQSGDTAAATSETP